MPGFNDNYERGEYDNDERAAADYYYERAAAVHRTGAFYNNDGRPELAADFYRRAAGYYARAARLYRDYPADTPGNRSGNAKAGGTRASSGAKRARHSVPTPEELEYEGLGKTSIAESVK